MNCRNSTKSLAMDWLVRSAFATALLLAILAIQPAQAQTYNVIYSFTGGDAGAYPNGVTIDRAGNFYGTTYSGGYTGYGCEIGCGIVFKLTHTGSGWVLDPIFTPRYVDAYLHSRVVFGPDGGLYGTGGYSYGYGYRVRPPETACKTALCSWTGSKIYGFGLSNGAVPLSEVAFDHVGNLWGTTQAGGCGEFGGVLYEGVAEGDGWRITPQHGFCGPPDGEQPVAQVIFDRQGNVYGMTPSGGDYFCQCGVIYEFSPNTGEYRVLYTFMFNNFKGRIAGNGANPNGGLVFDQAGNLYGATPTGGGGGGGTVFELSPSGDNWTFKLLYSFVGNGGGPGGTLAIDAAGNVYGATGSIGAYGQGSVFKLTPTGGSWTFTTLYDFGSAPGDGAGPGTVFFDSLGNLWGVTGGGGANGYGTVCEITP